MSASTNTTLPLSALESSLADDVPFGSYKNIAANVSGAYVQLLTLIAEEIPSARRLLSVINVEGEEGAKLVFRDSLTRRAIEDSVCKVVRGLGSIEMATIDTLLEGITQQILSHRFTYLNEIVRCTPIAGGLHYGYVWLDSEPSTPPGRWFAEEILRRVPGLKLAVPTEPAIKNLHSGAAFAEAIAPRLARSALSHNFAVVMGEFTDGKAFKSLTVPGLPGVMVLSPGVLGDHLQAAEALVHESVHLKYLDIDYFQHLFQVGFRAELSPRVTPTWHENTRFGNWPVDRVLTSMHVYTALAVFFALAAEQSALDAGIEPARWTARAMQCTNRAFWLLQKAREHSQVLTDSGRNFVEWIARVLAGLADCMAQNAEQVAAETADR